MSQNDGKFYLFQKKEEPKPGKLRLALFVIITAVWLAGMVLMFTSLKDIGYACWGISFLSALVMYFVQRHKSSLDEVREAEMLAAVKTDDAEGAEKAVQSADTDAAGDEAASTDKPEQNAFDAKEKE